MPLGVILIQAKAGTREGQFLPHTGKVIFVPDGKNIILGRTDIEFRMDYSSNRGIFDFRALPKAELIVTKEIQLGSSERYDLHSYWFTLSVESVTAFCRNAEGIGSA